MDLSTREHFRHALLSFFNQKKTAAESYRTLVEIYGVGDAPSLWTCEHWFRRFRSGDFNIKDKDRWEKQLKFKDADLQALLDGDPNVSGLKLATALNVTRTTIYKRLHAMGKINEDGKWVSLQLLENNSNANHQTQQNAVDHHRTYSDISLSRDFNIKDKDRWEKQRKFKDADLQALLDGDPNVSGLKLATALNVTRTTIYKRLHAMGKINEDGKWVSLQLPENNSNANHHKAP